MNNKTDKKKKRWYNDKNSLSIVVTVMFTFTVLIVIIFFLTKRIEKIESKIEASDISLVSLSDNLSDSQIETDYSSTETVQHILPDVVNDKSIKKIKLTKGYFDSAKASSSIDKKGTSGAVDNAFDDDKKTSWQCGENKYGIDEWVLVYNCDAASKVIRKVTVYNGYQSNKFNTETQNMFRLNTRVKKFTLEFDDGSTESFTLADSKKAQTFKFDERDTCYIKFTINSVYKGQKYKDTCIGEIIYE